MDIGNHRDDLNHINDYLLSFFQFAAQTRNPNFYKKEWIDFAGPEGEWFYGLYEETSKKAEKLRSSIQGIFELDPSRRQVIFSAIEHDMQFAEDSVSFQFESILLEKEEKKLIQEFFEYFYEEVLKFSHFHLKGLSEKNYGRAEFADHFFEGENKTLMYICPVCLQTVTNLRKEGHVEHYFGKKWIPCLMLHPNNLYFICPICNTVYKKKIKPLYKGDPEIRKIFLPYKDTVRDRTEMEFSHGLRTDRVKLNPANIKETYIDEKIEAFDKIFQLEERWSGLLENKYSVLNSKYRDYNCSDIHEMEERMRQELKDLKKNAGKNPETYLSMKYLEWILSFALKEFYAEIKQEKEENRHF